MDTPMQQKAVFKAPLKWPLVSSFILSNYEGLVAGYREEQVFCGEKKLVAWLPRIDSCCFMSKVEAEYPGRFKTEDGIVRYSLELSTWVGGSMEASTAASLCRSSGVPQDFTAEGGSHGRLSKVCHTLGEHRSEDTIQLWILYLLTTMTSSFCPTMNSVFA